VSDLNAGGATDELRDRDHYKDSVLVSDGTRRSMTAGWMEVVPLSGPDSPRVGHFSRGFTTLWPRSRPLGAGDFRHSWPKTAKLTTTSATIGLCALP
jgi:hypothetical protein